METLTVDLHVYLFEDFEDFELNPVLRVCKKWRFVLRRLQIVRRLRWEPRSCAGWSCYSSYRCQKHAEDNERYSSYRKCQVKLCKKFTATPATSGYVGSIMFVFQDGDREVTIRPRGFCHNHMMTAGLTKAWNSPNLKTIKLTNWKPGDQARTIDIAAGSIESRTIEGLHALVDQALKFLSGSQPAYARILSHVSNNK